MLSPLLLFYITYLVMGLGTVVVVNKVSPDIFHTAIREAGIPESFKASSFVILGFVFMIAWPIMLGEILKDM